MKTFIKIGLGLCLFMTSEAASANPWTRNQGQFYIDTTFSTLSANTLYGPDFEKITLGDRYSQYLLSLYAEVGVIDRWLTLVLKNTALRRSSIDGQGAITGVGDSSIGAWSGLLVAPFHLAAGVNVGIPTGEDRPSVSENAAPGADLIAASLPTGDDEVDVEFQLAAGHSIRAGPSWPLEHYALVRFGYWLRTRGFADAINWHTELGTRIPWKALKRFWFIGRVYGSESFASSADAARGTSGLGNGITHRSFGFEFTARVWRKLGLAVGVDGAFSARSLPAAAQWKFTLSYEN